MIGETAFVTKEIRGARVPGSVRARGEDWLAIPSTPHSPSTRGARWWSPTSSAASSSSSRPTLHDERHGQLNEGVQMIIASAYDGVVAG